MPGYNTKPTTREKAVILMIAAGLLDDWTEAYFAAEDKSKAECKKIQFPASSVSRWRNSEKVKNLLSEYRQMLEDIKANERLKGAQSEREKDKKNNEGESERTENNQNRRIAERVDYYDPANQRRQINQIIQQAQDDPKTQLDAIKAIQQTQRDDRQAAKDNKIQRFYVPVTCKTCPLMERAAKKLTK